MARAEAGEEWPIPDRLDPYIAEEDPNPVLPVIFLNEFFLLIKFKIKATIL